MKTSDVVIEDEIYICRYCGYQFKGNLDFKKHLNAKGCDDVLTNHINKPHNCLYCESMFSNESDLNSHTKIQHEKQVKHCGSCEMKFESDTEASEHTEKAHKKESLSCYKCDYETDGPTKLEVHALLLHGIVQCNKCEYAVEDFDILNEAMKKHTGRIIFQCGSVNLKHLGKHFLIIILK